MEHSAGRAGAPELPDERRDELVPEADPLGPLREDAHRPEPYAWDAWDGVLPDATDAADLRPASSDADAGKLAVPALDAPARDAWSPRVSLSVQSKRPAQPDAAAVLCTPDAVLSAEQSCAGPEAAADPQMPAVLPDALVRRQREARPMQESRAQPKPEVQPRRP